MAGGDDGLSSGANQHSYVAHNTPDEERAAAPQRSRNKQNLCPDSTENSNINHPVSVVIERLSKKVKSKRKYSNLAQKAKKKCYKIWIILLLCFFAATIPVLTTHTPYYTPMGDMEHSWDPEEAEEPEFEKEVNGDILEVRFCLILGYIPHLENVTN